MVEADVVVGDNVVLVIGPVAESKKDNLCRYCGTKFYNCVRKTKKYSKYNNETNNNDTKP